jgi:hypothetical protein
MPERGVGFIRHLAEIRFGDFSGHERTDHLDCDFPIGATEESRDGLGAELRPDLRHIQPAIAGEPGQHHVTEAKPGRFTRVEI